MKKKFVFKKNFYRERISTFFEVFPSKNIRIISYEDSLNSSCGLIGSFLEEINLKRDFFDISRISNFNESISMASYEILNFILFFSTHLRKCMESIQIKNIDVAPLTTITGTKFKLSYYEIKKLKKIFANDIKWLKKKFNIVYVSRKQKEGRSYSIYYSENYRDELVSIIPLLPDYVIYLLYVFFLMKNSTCINKNEFSLFKDLALIIEKKHENILHDGYYINNFDKLRNAYEKILNSKYPNSII